MESYVFQIISYLIGTGLVGLVALIINGVKSDVREMKEMLRQMVTESLCKERRSNIEKDINNLGRLFRGEKIS